MDISQISDLNQDEFTALLADIFEHSAWIPRAAWQQRPFADLQQLHQAMVQTVARASHQQQLDLILAHPELAGKAAQSGDIAESSRQEQKGAGLDQCSPDELKRLQGLNQAYQNKFHFPFIIAVAGRDRYQIMQAIEQRLDNDQATEFETALSQIYKIALIRLEKLFN